MAGGHWVSEGGAPGLPERSSLSSRPPACRTTKPTRRSCTIKSGSASIKESEDSITGNAHVVSSGTFYRRVVPGRWMMHGFCTSFPAMIVSCAERRLPPHARRYVVSRTRFYITKFNRRLFELGHKSTPHHRRSILGSSQPIPSNERYAKASIVKTGNFYAKRDFCMPLCGVRIDHVGGCCLRGRRNTGTRRCTAQ